MFIRILGSLLHWGRNANGSIKQTTDGSNITVAIDDTTIVNELVVENKLLGFFNRPQTLTFIKCSGKELLSTSNELSVITSCQDAIDKLLLTDMDFPSIDVVSTNGISKRVNTDTTVNHALVGHWVITGSDLTKDIKLYIGWNSYYAIFINDTYYNLKPDVAHDIISRLNFGATAQVRTIKRIMQHGDCNLLKRFLSSIVNNTYINAEKVK